VDYGEPIDHLAFLQRVPAMIARTGLERSGVQLRGVRRAAAGLGAGGAADCAAGGDERASDRQRGVDRRVRLSRAQLILWLAPGVSNEGRSSPLLALVPPSLGRGKMASSVHGAAELWWLCSGGQDHELGGRPRPERPVGQGQTRQLHRALRPHDLLFACAALPCRGFLVPLLVAKA